MSIEYVVGGLCAISNGDSILTSSLRTGRKVSEIRFSDVGNPLEPENGPGSSEVRAMKTSARTAALYATQVGLTHPSASFAKNSARPRPCYLVLVRQEVMAKLSRQIEGGKVLLIMVVSLQTTFVMFDVYLCTISDILSVLRTVTC